MESFSFNEKTVVCSKEPGGNSSVHGICGMRVYENGPEDCPQIIHVTPNYGLDQGFVLSCDHFEQNTNLL